MTRTLFAQIRNSCREDLHNVDEQRRYRTRSLSAPSSSRQAFAQLTTAKLQRYRSCVHGLPVSLPPGYWRGSRFVDALADATRSCRLAHHFELAQRLIIKVRALYVDGEDFGEN